MLNTHGLSSADIFCALYFHAKPVGLGIYHYIPGGLSLADAEAILQQQNGCADYTFGRRMKIQILERIDVSEYDPFYGKGHAQKALDNYFTSPNREVFHINTGSFYFCDECFISFSTLGQGSCSGTCPVCNGYARAIPVAMMFGG